MIEFVVTEIVNGWLVIHEGQPVFCKEKADVHREIEFIIGKQELPELPEPPKPPTEKKPSGIRQFDDED